MPQVNAFLEQPGNSPLNGYILVAPDTSFVGSAGEIVVSVPRKFELTGGAASMDLDATEVIGVPYRFGIYQYTNDGDVLIREFLAKVPQSNTIVQFSELFQQTGVSRDQRDTSIVSIARWLYNDTRFWDTLKSNIFTAKGTYSPTAFYSVGDIVSFDGSGYMCTSQVNIINIPPVSNNVVNPNWQLIGARGVTGTGTTGNNTPYDSNAWDGQLDAPSRNAIRDLVETLATKTEMNGFITTNNPTIDTPRASNTLPANANDTRIPTTAWTQARLAEVDAHTCPVGSIVLWGANSPPTGWLVCDGRSLNRADYPALFALIGTTYGSVSGTTFSLPDLRGRVPVGRDTSAITGDAGRIGASWADNLGQSGGTDTVTLTVSEIPSHTHQYTDIRFGTYNGTNQDMASGTAGSAINNGYTTASTGGGLPHNNVQPSITLNYIILAL